MLRASLLRSTPFRLALVFSLLFIVTFMIAGLIVFQVLRADLSARLDVTVHDTYAVVAATFSGSELEDLIATVDSHATLAKGEERFFSLVDATGAKIAGSFRAPPLVSGYSTASGLTLGIPSDDSYRVYSGKVGDNTLSVAISFSETEELEALLVTSLGWATVIVFGLAITGGALLASRVQRRLDLIAETMVEVSHGKLATRIPLIGRGDDIDQVSAQVNAALDRLSGLVTGMKHVSENIAHDLKTPLGRLQIILEDTAEAAADGKALTRGLAEALDECARINRTFDALLRIAQIEAGARKARFGAVSLDNVATDIADAYEHVASDAGMTLYVDAGTSGTIPPIQGDRQLLLQLCSNLIENAIHHCPRGTRIAIRLERSSDATNLIVADNGPGIPADERSNVLQRLYRLEKSRTTAGSGLGLSLVKAVADLHGATLELADNKPGLRILVRFPDPAS